MSRHHRLASSLALGVFALAGCSLFQTDTSYDPPIDPAKFVKVIDNPYFPIKPGTTHRFRATSDEGVEEITVTVTNETKVIAGVTATVVHDFSTRDGQLYEDTWDWFAQDSDGNVWYLGEDTKEYEKGKIDTSGSWEAGVKGAKPGIVMLAHPVVGKMYRQEYMVGEAEDEAQVIALDETVTVAAGKFTGCVKTKEWSRLDPGVLEHKYYAPGVGVVAEVTIEGGTEHVELLGD